MRSGIKRLAALIFGIAVLTCGLAVAQTDIASLLARAERGDAEAQNSLGLRYVLGDGIEQDKTAAHHWFELSAKQGYAKGQYNLAVMLGSGLGGQKDHKKSVKWYRKAADQGLNAADYNLTDHGFMFSNEMDGNQQKRQERREQ
ncbi:MAG: tetratricopeptide repeat protein [Candidatus Korobacteraceae bacterium]|jgi:TPR repeat protein